MFTYTTALKKLRGLKKRIRLIPGGTSGGKTIAILAILIDRAARTPALEISVVSESVPHLKRGALKDFKKLMQSTGRWSQDHYHGTDMKYTFANGATIEFFSADNDGKVRGARRDVLYVNECDRLPFAVYHQLKVRTAGDIWLDYNPAYEFWADTELAGAPDVEMLTLTYMDNEAAPANVVADIEEAKRLAETSAYWANWYKVYGLGQKGRLEGVVFENWREIDNVPAGARLIGRGIDFGFSNDPTAVVAAYLWQGVTIFDEEVYEKGLLTPDLAKLMKHNGARRGDYAVADSSDPRSIAELCAHGLTVVPVEKGPDSIMAGIEVMQRGEFYVTKRSANIKRELDRYSWAKDKNGQPLNTPIDAFNHAIDAMRYLAWSKLSKQAKPKKGLSVKN